MKNIICTIITSNYSHYAFTLHDSLIRFNPDVKFCVLVTLGDFDILTREEFSRRDIIVFKIDDFEDDPIALQLNEKYNHSYHDAYRWGMKPILLQKLLNGGYENVIYVDSDIYFFSKYDFLFEELKKSNLLLSPHWRCSDPLLNSREFSYNFLDGIYNGGFVGASQGGIPALQYWAKLCLFKCEVNRNAGFYVDQRYLDILPTRYEGISNITHKGCNIANWNIIDCKRVRQSSGEVLINDKYPIVFIHFTNSLLKGAYLWKNDEELIPYIEKYRDNILIYSNVDIIQDFFKKGIHLSSRSETIVINNNKHTFKRLIKKIYRKIKSTVFKKYL